MIRQLCIALARQGACKMSLSPVKIEILETLLLSGKPMKAVAVAQGMGKEFPPVMMHLLGLTKLGYVSSPEKSQYVITQKGKEALGIPDVTKEKAAAALAYSPHDKAFSFYCEVGKPLNVHAHNIRDFANKVLNVPLESIQFHMNRSDFEAWFNGLGDVELAKEVDLLKKKNMAGEDLRMRLHDITQQRYTELAALAGQPIYSE